MDDEQTERALMPRPISVAQAHGEGALRTKLREHLMQHRNHRGRAVVHDGQDDVGNVHAIVDVVIAALR